MVCFQLLATRGRNARRAKCKQRTIERLCVHICSQGKTKGKRAPMAKSARLDIAGRVNVADMVTASLCRNCQLPATCNFDDGHRRCYELLQAPSYSHRHQFPVVLLQLGSCTRVQVGHCAADCYMESCVEEVFSPDMPHFAFTLHLYFASTSIRAVLSVGRKSIRDHEY